MWARGIINDSDDRQCDNSLASSCASRDLARQHAAAKKLKDKINSKEVTPNMQLKGHPELDEGD